MRIAEMSLKNLNWGILGCGHIAKSFIESLDLVPEAHLVAAASRTPENRKQFKNMFQIPNLYDNYVQLVKSNEIDVIYIATTQNFHYEHIKLALSHNKHVLCEKPLTLNAHQAQEVKDLAQRKNLFLMEAMWMRFLPVMKEIRKLVNNNILGPIHQISAHFGYNKMHRKKNRLNNPELGGGVMLDMGIYPLSFAQMIFGKYPLRSDSNYLMTNQNVDGYSSYFLDYGNGQTAFLSASILFPLKEEAIVYGNKGYARIPLFHGGKRLYLVKNDDLDVQSMDELETRLEGKAFEFPYEKHGFQYEIQEVHRCLTHNKIESSIMPLDDSIEILQICDQFRKNWNFRYPSE